MTVQALGYIGLGVKDVEAWRHYAEEVLGVQALDDGAGGLKLRVDSRDYRMLVLPTGEEDISFAGWEVKDVAALEALAQRLEAAGVTVNRDEGELASARGVLGIISFADPAGLRCEAYWGATERFEQPFVSPRSVRFLTGEQGLGHIVIGVSDPAEYAAFYNDLLGFRLSDRIDMTMGKGTIVPVTFLHCNPRHHTLAFAPVPPNAPQKLIHLMLQVEEFDDVGFALDRCAANEVELATTLGRHSNDHMVSFYAYTPSGFEIEYGWGAREIDEKSWVPVRHDRASSWGHKFIGHGVQRA
tara:strand:- start:23510 stop:24406 length:897 start_codon:yes stop_codon:yes gene_type:complete